MASALTGSTPPTAPAAPTGDRPAALPNNPKGDMGKTEFLQLLVAQLKNQDPLDPSDGKEMAAQLAQFSSVEQLVSVNDTLNQIRDALRTAAAAPAAGTPAA